MTYSLNEIEAMGKRAARGVGLNWGLAEEAGKAARWLSAHNLGGAEALAETLTRIDGTSYDDVAPVSDEGTWHAPEGPLCPLMAGPALSDRAREIVDGQSYALGETLNPLLLAPYLASAAKLGQGAVELTWDGASITITPEGLSATGDQLTTSQASAVQCRFINATATVTPAANTGCDIDEQAWNQLAEFMTRYLAPDTEESRLAGAGAGLSDND